jgi:hypothetical protein
MGKSKPLVISPATVHKEIQALISFVVLNKVYTNWNWYYGTQASFTSDVMYRSTGVLLMFQLVVMAMIAKYRQLLVCTEGVQASKRKISSDLK